MDSVGTTTLARGGRIKQGSYVAKRHCVAESVHEHKHVCNLPEEHWETDL